MKHIIPNDASNTVQKPEVIILYDSLVKGRKTLSKWDFEWLVEEYCHLRITNMVNFQVKKLKKKMQEVIDTK